MGSGDQPVARKTDAKILTSCMVSVDPVRLFYEGPGYPPPPKQGLETEVDMVECCIQWRSWIQGTSCFLQLFKLLLSVVLPLHFSRWLDGALK